MPLLCCNLSLLCFLITLRTTKSNIVVVYALLCMMPFPQKNMVLDKNDKMIEASLNIRINLTLFVFLQTINEIIISRKKISTTVFNSVIVPRQS